MRGVGFEPQATSLVLTSCIVMLMVIETSPVACFAAVTLLEAGYGLAYSAINGLVATEAPEAPEGLVPQALLLSSLSYFVGMFGFPLVADALIAEYGVRPMLMATMAIALIPLGRLLEW